MTAPTMEYTFLGNSGLKVSNICLGGLTFGIPPLDAGPRAWFFNSSRQMDEAAAHKVMDKFVELGGNFIDTANIYAYGHSEKTIGTWIQRRQNRDDIVVATKVKLPINRESKNGNGLSRRNIVKSCEDSLERLKTDFIDLYQCHEWDNATPIDETVRTLDDLVRCGKIRYFGFSNVCGWQMQKIVDTAKEFGLSKCISLQQQYNLLSRDSELEAFSVCKSEGIGVIPWGPLKTGLLTGKFVRNNVPDPTESRIGYVFDKTQQSTSTNWGKHQDDDKYWTLIDIMRDIAKAHGKTVPQVALRWLLQKPVVASVIVGVTSITQLEDNVGASSGWELTQEELKQLNEAGELAKPYPYNMIWGDSNISRYNCYNPDSVQW